MLEELRVTREANGKLQDEVARAEEETRKKAQEVVDHHSSLAQKEKEAAEQGKLVARLETELERVVNEALRETGDARAMTRKKEDEVARLEAKLEILEPQIGGQLKQLEEQSKASRANANTIRTP